MTDQQRGGITRRSGFGLDTMPFLDSIADEGFWTDRHYTTVPQCVPARSSLLTGRTASATGVRINPQIKKPIYSEDLVDVIGNAGYTVGFTGKVHCYLDEDRFDHWYPVTHHGGKPTNKEQRRFDDWLSDLGWGTGFEPAPVSPTNTLVGRLVTDAINWIDSVSSGESFFLNLWIPEPHSPYHAPEPYHSLFDPENLPPLPSGETDAKRKGFDYEVAQRSCHEHAGSLNGFSDYNAALPTIRSIYYGMLRMVDDQLRRLFEFLEEADLHEETLVIFTSDHGDYAGSYGMMRKGAGICEALTNVPFIIAGPGIEPSLGGHEMHSAVWDLLPTIADLVGEEIPRGVQGRSLLPVLQGAEYPSDEFNSIYLECGDGGIPYTREEAGTIDTSNRQIALTHIKRGIRKGDWKLVHDTKGQHSFKLFNVEQDPDELDDLANHRPDIVGELKDELLWWSGRLDAFEHPDEPLAKRNPHNWWDHTP